VVTLDELHGMKGFSRRAEPGTVTFLPEPDRRPRFATIISVDDHVVEPSHVFEGRMPCRLAERAPRIIEHEGAQVWLYEGTLQPNLGLNAVAGRPLAECGFEPTRFDHMRPGAYDIDARVRDMDINGVYASVCFPSALPGFAGWRLQQLTTDRQLALAVVRAWNSWHLEEWAGTHPGRIIPCQLPWLLDVDLAADEIRANADRGFKAVTFPEAPDKLGLPTLHSGYWEPFMRACEETETVICLHVGSSSVVPSTAPDAPVDCIGVLFFGYAMFAAVDWLYSKIALDHPAIKICMSEGGIAWVPGLLDRLDHVSRYQTLYGTWDGIDTSPADLLRRNFWFCAIEDPSNFQLRHRIGIEHVLVESDYPHLDSTWPNTQQLVYDQIGSFPDHEVRQICWENASRLFRHPVPPAVQADPEAF
jgi:predicted TIM-barrel fold metal-dependent hydrolase